MARRRCWWAWAGLLWAVVAWPQDGLRELYLAAQQAQASGDLAAATLKYQAIIRLQPGMAEAYANLGNLYYQQAQYAPAKTAYRKALELKPALSAPHFFLGVIAFNEHRYSFALEELQKASAAAHPLVYAYLGYVRFARGEFAEAAASLEKADEDSDVLYHLSKSYGHLADEAFVRLQAKDPQSVYLFLARAHLAESKDDGKEAAREYDLARQMSPDGKLADDWFTYNDGAPGGASLKAEIAAWRRKAEASSRPATASELYRQGEAYQALAYLTSLAVMESDADSYRAHQLRAQINENANDDAGAIKEYEQVLQRKPDLQNIHFAIGTLYWKDHRLEDAAKELKAELKGNPNQPRAMYELGDICLSDGRTAEAEGLFLAALKLEPGMPEPRFALEKIYTESGRLEKSLEQLQAVTRLNSSDATAHYRLAVVYRKLGRAKEAERELALFDETKSYNGSSRVK